MTVTVSEKVHPVVALFTGDGAKRYIEKFLPEGVDLERVAATVMLAMQQDKTGQLGKCTPTSLVLGVARITQWGLELGTTAHLLPFKNTFKERQDDGSLQEVTRLEATPVADYKGLAELMIGSGAVRFVDAQVVYGGDYFEYELGLEAKLAHRPCAKVKRGMITHAYCILHLPYGRQVFTVMPVEDIEEIRQKFSKQWKNGPLPSWYAKKTVVRQVSKLVPKNPRLAKVLAVMEQDREIEVETDPTPGAPKAEGLIAGDHGVEAALDDTIVDREPGDDETPSVPY